MMHRQGGEDRIKAVILKRKRFGKGLNDGGRAHGTLRNHRPRRFNGDHYSRLWFVRTRPGADVQDCLAARKCALDCCADPRVAPG